MIESVENDMAEFQFESEIGSRLISLWLLTGAGGDNREFAFKKIVANYADVPVDRPTPWGPGWIVALGFFPRGSVIDVSWEIEVQSPIANKAAVGYIVGTDLSKPVRLSIFDMPDYSTISGGGTITVPK